MKRILGLALAVPLLVGGCPFERYTPPVASIEASTTEGVAPLTVTFTAVCTPARNAKGVMLIFWDFGGLAQVIGPGQVTYTFDTPGVYLIRLGVDYWGSEGYADAEIEIHVLQA